MPQTIDQFLANVSPTIRSRGKSYFNEGAFEVLEKDFGNFFFTVFGSDVYEVAITISGNSVTSYYCDCPYDQGPVCKHIVACLYYINSTLDEIITESEEITTNNGYQFSIGEILKKATKQELIDFVVSITHQNSLLKSDVLAAFSQYTSISTEELVKSQFKARFREKGNGWIFLGERFNHDVFKIVGSVLGIADKAIADKQYEKAFITTITVFNIISSAAQNLYYYEDDSEELIDLVLSMLSRIGKSANDLQWNSRIIDYCISEIKKDTERDFGFEGSFLPILIELCQTKSHVETYVAYLQEKNNQGFFQDFYNHQAVELLTKICGQDRANEFIFKNINTSFMRKKAIEICIEKNDFIYARNLAFQGLQKPSFADNDWKDVIVSTSLKLEDKETAYSFAKELFLSNSTNRHHYFSTLLSIVGNENFDALINELKNDVRKANVHTRTDLENFIHIKAADWDALLSNIQAEPTLFSITKYEKYLLKHKREPFLEMYVEVLCDFVDKNLGRDKYIEACTHLKKFKAWGEYTLLNEMNDEFKRSFKNRRALMEELAKV